jgi:hypothetical protein
VVNVFTPIGVGAAANFTIAERIKGSYLIALSSPALSLILHLVQRR